MLKVKSYIIGWRLFTTTMSTDSDSDSDSDSDLSDSVLHEADITVA